jgi:hypothetical protein
MGASIRALAEGLNLERTAEDRVAKGQISPRWISPRC